MLNVPGPQSGLHDHCPACGGTGQRFEVGEDERMMAVMVTVPGRCRTCGGSGKRKKEGDGDGQ